MGERWNGGVTANINLGGLVEGRGKGVRVSGRGGCER